MIIAEKKLNRGSYTFKIIKKCTSTVIVKKI